jgi:hypothetical protein
LKKYLEEKLKNLKKIFEEIEAEDEISRKEEINKEIHEIWDLLYCFPLLLDWELFSKTYEKKGYFTHKIVNQLN